MMQPNHETKPARLLPAAAWTLPSYNRANNLKGDMYTLRCTAPLLSRFKGDPRLVVAAGPAPTTTLLGDWYANRLNVGHQRLILCVSELSLLSMILPARDLDQLPQRLSESVAVLLELLDLLPDVVANEVGQMESARLDRTASKSVLGSMTDFAHMAKAHIRDAEPLGAVVRDLHYCPCGPLGYAYPADKARQLLGGENADSRQPKS